MLLRIIVCCYFLSSTECWKPQISQQCLTGYMTDVQSWVDDKGILTISEEYDCAIDLSANSNPVPVLKQKITFMKERDVGDTIHVKYLSMARCRLTIVPTVFLLGNFKGLNLSDTLEYITFYGNNFSDLSSPGELYEVSMNATDPREQASITPFQRQASVTWSEGFKDIEFPRLRELDLRACSIQILSNYIFKDMPVLEALYIGENEIYYIEAQAFAGLNHLIHLDISKNGAITEKRNQQTLAVETLHVFRSLTNLLSLDMSFTKLPKRNVNMLKYIGSKLTRLSLCETGITNLEDGIFNGTALKILDLSGNNGIFGRKKTLSGLEETLQVLYAKGTGLKTIDVFERFTKLEILVISLNEITELNPQVLSGLDSLQILDLDFNRVTTWFSARFSLTPSLKLLSLRDNNINLITNEMITDIADVQYVAISGNFIVCNCHTRDLIDLALHNEHLYSNNSTLESYTDTTEKNQIQPFYRYHRGYIDFNHMIIHRKEVTIDCNDNTCCDFNEELHGKFLLLDYHPTGYVCWLVAESKPIEFSQMDSCSRTSRDIDYNKVLEENERRLYMLFSIPGFLLMLIMVFVFRRNFRYCLITLRNSAMLSVIHKHEVIDDGTIFHYDVFVSYCNEDRNWVLDHLLPHLESDCSISACLHERDFQVGHSILENIVSCMDRSKSIMLIISQRFLLSQWCQFEMHLAQHRLLETRREDLTLVLLEQIPRRLRPNTLHYLMLTKTYIVWPKEDNEQALFWRRIRKTLVTMKQRQSCMDGVSLA